MAKLKAAAPTWFCFGCQEIVPRRLGLFDGIHVVCLKYECVASVILSETWKNIPKRQEPEHPATCPTCKGEWKMAIQKKLPSPVSQKSREQLLHEMKASGDEYDPGYIPSLSFKILNGKEKPPVGTVFAKDMAFETQYLNYEGTARIVRLVALRKDDVEIEFYSGSHGWLKCSVAHMYPLTTDLAGVTPGQSPKEATKMAKKDRKHSGAGKVAKPVRAISEKTGYKEGTVGDLAGTALLAYKTEEKIVEAVAEQVAASFRAKGKSATKDVTEARAKHIISVLRKADPKRFPSPEKAEKVVKALKKSPKQKKEAVAA